MTPTWLETHASNINSARSSTDEQLTFEPGHLRDAALLKVPIIPAGILTDSSLITLKIVLSLDEDIGKKEDSDPSFGVSDGESFVGFEMVDEKNYGRYSPCFGIEGISGNSLTEIKYISMNSSSQDTYTGQVVITLKLNERWGLCSLAQDEGFENKVEYNKRLRLSNGLTLEVYKDNKYERVGIKFIEVTIIMT